MKKLAESLRSLWDMSLAVTGLASTPAPPAPLTQLERYAEALADCGNVVQAGAMIGVKATRSRELYRKLVKDLGEQAK